MKLVIAVVQDKDRSKLNTALISAGISSTKLSTKGGFLRSGNTTFMIGVADDRVDEVLEIIKTSSCKRDQYVAPPMNRDQSLDPGSVYPLKVAIGGATVFVLPIEAYYNF